VSQFVEESENGSFTVMKTLTRLTFGAARKCRRHESPEIMSAGAFKGRRKVHGAVSIITEQ
jgi:hypothetical protein